MKAPRLAAQVNKFFAVAVTATATLGLLTGHATAGPPFVTDDPEPVPYQHFEFYNISLGTAIRGDTFSEGPAWEYNYGIIPNGQIHIIAPLTFDTQAAAYGYGDTELGFKYRFIDEDKNGSRPMVGIYPLLELPTGDESRALGAGYVRAYFPLWLQKSFGDWTTYGGGGYWINQGDDTATLRAWLVGGGGLRGTGTKRRNWSVRTAVCACMALYLRELRELLVTLAREAKNSDNAPKGYPGGAGSTMPFCTSMARARRRLRCGTRPGCHRQCASRCARDWPRWRDQLDHCVVRAAAPVCDPRPRRRAD